MGTVWQGLDLARIQQALPKVPVSRRREFLEYVRYNKILTFKPDPWQAEFIALGSTEVQRGLICANRVGKTYTATYEAACHMTGLYPDWWEGVKYETAEDYWFAGYSLEQMSDAGGVLDLLFGSRDDESWGSGWIPRSHLPDMNKVAWESRIKGIVKQITIKHVKGGTSRLIFKSYSQGQAAAMGSKPKVIFIDEEPKDSSIHGQYTTRVMSHRDGRIVCTFTPEWGNTQLVREFFQGRYQDGCKRVTVWEASHIDEETIQKMLKSYPPREHDLRMKGIPTLGSGAVYQAEEKDISYDEGMVIPPHWKRLVACDFGYNHPAALAFMAYDPDTRKYYLYDTWKKSGATLGEMANVLISRGNLPLIYPHDGDNETQGAGGESMAAQLASYGVNVLKRFSNPPDAEGKTNNYVAAGLYAIRQAMLEDRCFIKKTLSDFWSEYRLYQYDDKGKIVKKDDDLLDAWRYAFQSIELFGVTGGANHDADMFKKKLTNKLRNKQR